MSKVKSKNVGLGDFIIPIVELISIILTEFIKGGALLTGFLIEKLIGNKKTGIKKLERDDLKKIGRTEKMDSIGFSLTGQKEVIGSDVDKSKHSLVVGASGSGKSVLLDTLMFEDMRSGKPVIYIDPKGDNASLERFISLCRMCNREYQVFSEYYQKDNKLAINPVLEGSVNHIADRIFKSFTWSEEYYANKSRQALKVAIESLKDSGEIVTLEKVLHKLICITDGGGKQKSALKRADIEGLITKLDNIVNSDFGSSLNKVDGASFTKLRREGKCVYIGLSVLGYAETARAIGKLFLGDINYSVYDTYRTIDSNVKVELKPLGLYIDELSAVINDEFIELLNKCRGAKVEVNTAFQTSSDLNKVNPDLCQQVFENSLNWFVMKQRMQSAAEDISNSIGTIETTKQTVRIEDGQELDLGSQRKVEELIVHPNIIKNLNVGQCVLLRQQPTRLDLINVKYIDEATIQKNLEFFEYNSWISKRQFRPLARKIEFEEVL